MTFEVRDKSFSPDIEVHSKHVLEQKMHLFPLCFPQTVTNELLIELGRSKASGWKMTKTKRTDTGGEKRRGGGERDCRAAEVMRCWKTEVCDGVWKCNRLNTLMAPVSLFFYHLFQVYGKKDVNVSCGNCFATTSGVLVEDNVKTVGMA